MFSSKLNKGIIFKNILLSVEGLFDDFEMNISFQGISIHKMDKTKIYLACIELKSEGFQEFKCEKSVNIAISIHSLEKVFKDIDEDDSLILIYDDKEQLKIKLENPKTYKTSEYEIPLIENYENQQFLVLGNKSNSIIIPSKQFEKICDDLSATAKEIIIKCYSDGKAAFFIDNEINGKKFVIESNQKEEPEKLCKVEGGKETEIVLNLNLLKKIAKAHLAKQVKLLFSHDSPLFIEYNFGKLGFITFYLAPIKK